MCEGSRAFFAIFFAPWRISVRNPSLMLWLLNSARACARRRRRFTKSFLNLVVGDFRGFSNILLVRLEKRVDQIEGLRVADTGECFQQSGIDSRRVDVRPFEKRIKQI